MCRICRSLPPPVWASIATCSKAYMQTPLTKVDANVNTGTTEIRSRQARWNSYSCMSDEESSILAFIGTEFERNSCNQRGTWKPRFVQTGRFILFNSWFLVPFLPSHPASSMRASLVGIQEQEEMTVDRLGNPQKQVGRSGSYAHLAVSSALYTLVDVQVRRIVTVFVDEVLSGVLFFGCFLQSAKNRCNRSYLNNGLQKWYLLNASSFVYEQ
uniref:Secreted protein n=1 Tax=Ascaris lumbricoides TaxID=6252 RepID=A0A0M3IU57_ASCLU